jgi:hypothetical protein
MTAVGLNLIACLFVDAFGLLLPILTVRYSPSYRLKTAVSYTCPKGHGHQSDSLEDPQTITLMSNPLLVVTEAGFNCRL